MAADTTHLASFFHPRNVAVIGASADTANLGRNIIKNLLNFGYQGEILPVNIQKGVLFGQRIYGSVEEVDHPIDLAVILTPAKTIPGIMEACGRKGIRRLVIESGGFSEMGEEGLPLAEACLSVARRYGIRFLGPNGIGVTNLQNGLVLPFWPMREDLKLGKVSILAQSGGVGLSYLGFLAEENIGLNKFVSMGNKLNVDENDLLEVLIEDEGTEIILLYLEGFKDGRRFLEIAARSPKPILVHKSNRFQESARIAHSHTAALFADDRLVDQALEQVGCVRVNTMVDAVDYVKSLTLPPLKGNRLAVVSRSGGHAVIAADACAHYGFDLPPFPRDFLARIETSFRAKVIRLQNPLDLGDLFDLAVYENIVEEMLKRGDVDGVLLVHGYRRGLDHEDSRKLVCRVEELIDAYRKPVAVAIFTEAVEVDFLRRHTGVPIFTAPENAMRAFYLSHQWGVRKKAAKAISPLAEIRSKTPPAILPPTSGRTHLLLSEATDFVRAYGFPVPEYRLARSAGEAAAAWRTIGGPVALKVNRPHISHKTDAGAVILGIESSDAAAEAFENLARRLAPEPLEAVIQAMAPGGREVILGGKQDEVFGPVVLFGLGGIFVEALEDVAWRAAPIERSDARAMMQQIRGRKILEGIRGEEPCDFEALEDLLVQLSRMLVDHPGIFEIDINPVRVGRQGRGAAALDARILLRSNGDTRAA